MATKRQTRRVTMARIDFEERRYQLSRNLMIVIFGAVAAICTYHAVQGPLSLPMIGFAAIAMFVYIDKLYIVDLIYAQIKGRGYTVLAFAGDIVEAILFSAAMGFLVTGDAHLGMVRMFMSLGLMFALFTFRLILILGYVSWIGVCTAIATIYCLGMYWLIQESQTAWNALYMGIGLSMIYVIVSRWAPGTEVLLHKVYRRPK